MKTTVFIVLDRHGAVRMTKRAPDLGRFEIAIGLRLVVPDSAFRAPTVFADLAVPDHAVIVPEIKVDVLDPPAQADTRRMAETGTGSGRSPSGTVPAEQGCAQPDQPKDLNP